MDWLLVGFGHCLLTVAETRALSGRRKHSVRRTRSAQERASQETQLSMAELVSCARVL